MEVCPAAPRMTRGACWLSEDPAVAAWGVGEREPRICRPNQLGICRAGGLDHRAELGLGLRISARGCAPYSSRETLVLMTSAVGLGG